MSNSFYEEAGPSENYRLLIGNIPLAMTKLYLDILFLDCCNNLKTKCYYDSDDQFLGVVELVFKEKENADRAYFTFQGTRLLANELKVDLFDGNGRRIQVTPKRVCPTPSERADQMTPDGGMETKIQEHREDDHDWQSTSSFYSCTSPLERVASPEKLSYADVAKRLEQREGDRRRSVSSLSHRHGNSNGRSPSLPRPSSSFSQANKVESPKKTAVKPQEDVEKLKTQLSNLVPTISPLEHTANVQRSQPNKGFFKRMAERKEALTKKIQEIERSK